MRRPSLLCALALMLIALPAWSVPRPPGASPLRYRDSVFGDVEISRDIPYGSAVGASGDVETLKLDLYEPAGDTEPRRPAIVVVHGGGYGFGDKRSGVATDVATTFATHGYLTVSINYRLLAWQYCPGELAIGLLPACWDAALGAKHDAQAAVRWLRANAGSYRIDPTRIGIAGESVGGITAALVGASAEDPGDSGNPGPSSAVGGFVSISGGLPADLPGGGFLGPGDAPGLLLASEGEIAHGWSVHTAQTLLGAHVAAFMQTLPGSVHAPYFAYRDTITTESSYFFYDLLRLGASPSKPPTVPTVSSGQDKPRVIPHTNDRAPPSQPPGAPPRCRVPNVKRKTLRQARKALAKSRCKVGRVKRRRSRAVRRGRIVGQSPRPSASRRQGTRVNLVLSSGR